MYPGARNTAEYTFVVEKRPVFVTKDGKGQAIGELFA